MLPAQGNIWPNPHQGQHQQQHPVAPPIVGNQGSSPPIMLYNPNTGTRVSYMPSMPPPPFFPNSTPIGTPMAPSSAVPQQMRAHEHQMPMSYLTPQTSPIPNSSPTSFWSSSAPLQGQQIGFMSSPGEQQMYEQFLFFQQHQERLRMAQMAASGFQGQQVQSLAPQAIGQIHSQVPGQFHGQGVAPPQQEPRGQPLQEEAVLRRLIEADDRQAPQMNLQAPPQVQAAPPQEARQVPAATRPLPPGVRPYKGPWFPEEPEKKEKEPMTEKKISIKVEGHPAPPVSPVSLPDAITPQQLESVKEGPPPEQVAPPAENLAPRDPRISCCPTSIYYKPPRQAEQLERQVIPKDRAEEPVEPVQPPAPEKRVVQPTAAVPETMVEPQPKQLEGQKRPENVQAQGDGHQKRAEGEQGADQTKKAPPKPRKTMPTVPPIIIKRKVRITETRPDDDHLQPCQEKLQKQKPPHSGDNQQQKRPVEDAPQQRRGQAERPSEQQGPQGPQQHLPHQEDLEIQEVRSDGLQDPRKVPCPKAKMKTPSELAAIKMEMMDYEDSERRQKMKQKKDKRRIEEENEDRENREQPSMFDLFGPDPLPTSPRARKRRSSESTDSESSKKNRRSVDEEELAQLRISVTPPSSPSTLNAPMKEMRISCTPAKDLPPWRSTTSEPYVPPQLTTLRVQLVQGEGDDTETIPAMNEDRDRDFDEEEVKSNIFERFQSCLNSDNAVSKVSKNITNTSVNANMDVENSSTSSRSSEAKKINDVVNQPSNENIFGSLKQETTNKNNEEALFVPSHVCTGYYCDSCEMMDLEETLRIAHLPRFRPNLQ